MLHWQDTQNAEPRNQHQDPVLVKIITNDLALWEDLKDQIRGQIIMKKMWSLGVKNDGR